MPVLVSKTYHLPYIMDRCNTLAKTLLVQTSFIAWGQGQLVFYLWICKSVWRTQASGCTFDRSILGVCGFGPHPWWTTETLQKSHRFQWWSRLQFLLRLVFLDSRMSKCVMQNFGRFVICLLLMRVFLFFATFPPQSSFFFGCVSCWVRLISIVYITLLKWHSKTSKLYQKTITSQGPWKKSTHFPPKKMVENQNRCFLLWIFPGGSILQTTGQGSFRRRLNEVDGLLRV